MHRIPVAQRKGLEQVALDHDYDFLPESGIPYWNDTAYYRFTLAQIEDDLEAPAEEIEGMCIEVLKRVVVSDELFRRLEIPELFWDYISNSWKSREKDLYGRLDLRYDGKGPAKLYEYNADTPTTLYETAEFQWLWLQQAADEGLIPSDCDQFNEIYEDLVTAFGSLEIAGQMHFTCKHSIEEDRETVDYLEDCAKEAGVETVSISVEDIGIDPEGRFTDLEDYVIETLFKLYPWEWLMEEEFGKHLFASGVSFFEPPWKGVLSNKGILALLWAEFEGHPNLLPTYFEDDPRAADLADSVVRKPLYSRRGQNVQVIDKDNIQIQTTGPYGAEGHVVQEYLPPPQFAEHYPVMGCWLVAGRAAGLGIREGANVITTEDARFVPHVILD